MSKSMRSRMVYRALVQRPAGSTFDPDGHPVYGGWTTHLAALPIYIYEKKSAENFSTSQISTISEYYGQVPLGTNIKETDRINGVKLRNGAVFSDKIFRVENIVRRGLSHIELDLKVVSS